jgi:hypothetical protein
MTNLKADRKQHLLKNGANNPSNDHDSGHWQPLD